MLAPTLQNFRGRKADYFWLVVLLFVLVTGCHLESPQKLSLRKIIVSYAPIKRRKTPFPEISGLTGPGPKRLAFSLNQGLSWRPANLEKEI
jgi:hypothetical protein